MSINTSYYANLQSTIDNIPVPDVAFLDSLSPDDLQAASDQFTEDMTKIGNTCNQALTGVTDKACAQLALILPVLTIPTDPLAVLSYLSDIAAVFQKPYDDLLATVTDMIPVSTVVSLDYATKITEVTNAFAAVTSVPIPPIPTAPTVDAVSAC